MLWPWGGWVLPGGRIVMPALHPVVWSTSISWHCWLEGAAELSSPPWSLDIGILEAVFFFPHCVFLWFFLLFSFFLWNLLMHFSDTRSKAMLSCDIPNVLCCGISFSLLVQYLGFQDFQYLLFSLVRSNKITQAVFALK